MKPAPFQYYAPESLGEALRLLSHRDGDEVKVLAGGQSLLALMNLRLVRPDVLVDVGRLQDLGAMRVTEEAVTIGAGVTHARVERSSELSAALPLLPYAAGHIAHPPIRSRGTVGGSLAHADPSAEWPTVLSALDARLHLQSDGRGSRWVFARAFFRGFLSSALEADEILTEIEIRRPDSRVQWAFREVARQSGAFATVIVCVVALVDRGNEVRDVSVSVGGCGEIPYTFTGPDLRLEGEPLSAPSVSRAGEIVSCGVEPLSDIHASSTDRRQLARTLVERALRGLGDNGDTSV